MPNPKAPNKQAQPVAPPRQQCAERDPQPLEIQKLRETLVLSVHNIRKNQMSSWDTPVRVFYGRHRRNYRALLGTGAISAADWCPVLGTMLSGKWKLDKVQISSYERGKV